MTSSFLLDAIVLLAAAVAIVPIFQYLRIGAIPGYLFAGILLSPSLLGYFKNIEDIKHLADLGVVLLLFVIGIELKPLRIWNMRLQVLGLGGTQLVFTAVVLTFILQWIFTLSWGVALLIGFALALSSTAFVLQLLIEKNALTAVHGRAAFAILLFQDLAVVPLLALVAVMSRPESMLATDLLIAIAEAVAILLLIILIARFVLNPTLELLARMASTDIFTATALLLVLGFAGLFEWLGLSLAMGAFVAGLLISDSSFRHQIMAEIEPFRSLLLGLFFMTIGMALNIRIFIQTPGIILACFVILLAVKILVLFILARLFKLDSKYSGALALLLSQAGEFSLVIIALAFSNSLIDFLLFEQLLIIVLLTMLATPLMDKMALHILRWSPNTCPQQSANFPGEILKQSPIVIAGFGRMGHRIGEILDILRVPYIAIDNKITIVNDERARGRSVYFGNAQNPEVLRKAGVARAPLAIVAIDHLEAAAKVVASLHRAFPRLPIFARGHNSGRCRELHSLGASYTISETFEASTQIAYEALLLTGKKEEEIKTIMANFKENYYNQIADNHSIESESNHTPRK